MLALPQVYFSYKETFSFLYLPHGITIPEGRAKPWGTEAVLSFLEYIHELFAVINADDRAVTRGICTVNNGGYLTAITETSNITQKRRLIVSVRSLALN